MDPITQGALGAALPLSISKRPKLLMTAWLGCLAGMSPDIDVLIRSPTDPILFLEYHRQFTHSLIFIPIGALICTLLAYRWTRSEMAFKESYLVCFLGYGTHALLDACTSYGTLLAWPFSYVRIAWNNVSVFDPMVTVPLLLLIFIAVNKSKPLYAKWGMLWVFTYLSFGVFQNQRAESFALSLADARGHQPDAITAKPGLGSLLLWKSIYEWQGYYYVDGVRTGFEVQSLQGDYIKKLDAEIDLPWLKQGSQQAKDLDRFSWFSQGYLAIDKENPLLIIDMRYSMLPNEIKSMWGIQFDPEAESSKHVQFLSTRDVSEKRISIFKQMLSGSYTGENN